MSSVVHNTVSRRPGVCGGGITVDKSEYCTVGGLTVFCLPNCPSGQARRLSGPDTVQAPDAKALAYVHLATILFNSSSQANGRVGSIPSTTVNRCLHTDSPLLGAVPAVVRMPSFR